MMRAARLRIEGVVQGVGFRHWVEARAGVLGLSGWVRNRIDGSVEAVAQGSAEQMQQFVADCGNGPAGAHVRHVEIKEISPDLGLAGKFIRLATV